MTTRDIEVTSPPTDSISCLEFSPAVVPQIFLIAGSWDNCVRCWEIDRLTGQTAPRAMQTMQAPILDVCWNADGTQVYMASCDNTLKCWDLASNQTLQIGNHDAAVKSCHFIKGDDKTCVMTTSWDKTLKFWDSRAPNPLLTLGLNEKPYCVDVDYPMAIVGTANNELNTFQLQGTPFSHKRYSRLLRYQFSCVALFRDKKTPGEFNYGVALGSIEGRIAIHHFNSTDDKDNFAFKCHRSGVIIVDNKDHQDVYPVNDLKFHPIHGTFATVGADGCYNFWDKNSRTKMRTSDVWDQSISCCAFNSDGEIFAYAVNYDWSKGHQHYDRSKKISILLHPCMNDMKPRANPNSST